MDMEDVGTLNPQLIEVCKARKTLKRDGDWVSFDTIELVEDIALNIGTAMYQLEEVNYRKEE